MQRSECGELFGDDDRLMIGQHHPGRPDPDSMRTVGDGLDQQCRGAGCHTRHRVMFGDPETVISRGFRELRAVQGLP